jgi:hypothetical protein
MLVVLVPVFMILVTSEHVHLDTASEHFGH